jgi:hypothetical protein
VRRGAARRRIERRPGAPAYGQFSVTTRVIG